MINLKNIRNEISTRIKSAKTLAELETVRVSVFGKKGIVSERLRQLSQMPVEERKSYGSELNQIKTELFDILQKRYEVLNALSLEKRLLEESLDITRPVRPVAAEVGRIHPITQTLEEVMEIFHSLNFSRVEGPDIETDYYNFTALNFAPDHPAREMYDTFFLPEDSKGEKRLLRTHTSPVQIHTMEKHAPPFRIVIPGKTYRKDSDATHTPMFHQLEGLVIDETSNVAEMKGILETFCRLFFDSKDLKLRFRPSFFPFTEPSLEVDIQCNRSGDTIRVGEGKDWLEILGCGMVHPNVLKNGGIDPVKYRGFAWGIGIDRLAMLKYGLSDLRAFFQADVRWLTHYGFSPLSIPRIIANTFASV